MMYLLLQGSTSYVLHVLYKKYYQLGNNVQIHEPMEDIWYLIHKSFIRHMENTKCLNCVCQLLFYAVIKYHDQNNS